ncbi:MAG: lipopolysaccharide biosynthesis protein [Lewinella sp.]
MSKTSNFLKNMGAGTWSRASNILFKLIQVPMFLVYLSPEDYGRWLILYSLPSWLAYASQGFGSVAANEIPIQVAAGDEGAARKIYSTSFAFMLALTLGGLTIVGLIAPWFPWADFLKAGAQRHGEIAMAAVWLTLSVLLSFLGELFYGRFRAGQKAHTAILVASFHPWIELVLLFIALQFTSRFDLLALFVLGATVVYLLIYGLSSYRAFPSIKFRYGEIDKTQFGMLFKKGFAFQAFPLGNALLFQGNLLVVQLLLGPAAVTLFGTVRTLVRVLNQALELVSKSIWPEMSYLYGAGDLAGMRSIHRMGVGLCVLLALVGVCGMALSGGYLYEFWVRDSLQLPFFLLLLFLLPVPFNALWITSSTVLLASNQHEKLATRYLVATALSAVGCIGLTYAMGIGGAAMSTVVADLILIPYVVQQALLHTGDKWSSFPAGVMEELKLGVSKISGKIKLT